jgi:hypothetical protein
MEEIKKKCLQDLVVQCDLRVKSEEYKKNNEHFLISVDF